MKKEEKQLVAVEDQLPVNAVSMSMFEQDAAMGMEEADKNAFAIPFLSLLQGLSPAIETVDGAKAGLFINTITNELYAKAVIVPCAYQRRFLRWSPRSSGGGFRGEYHPKDVETGNVPGMTEFNGTYFMDVPEGTTVLMDAQGHSLYDTLSDTRIHFVLVQSQNGSWQPAIMSLSSTQIKRSKRFMSIINGIEIKGSNGMTFTPPSFSHVYSVESVKESNTKGSWYSCVFSMEAPIADAEVYAKAKAFSQSVTEGTAVAQHQNDEVLRASESESDSF